MLTMGPFGVWPVPQCNIMAVLPDTGVWCYCDSVPGLWDRPSPSQARLPAARALRWGRKAALWRCLYRNDERFFCLHYKLRLKLASPHHHHHHHHYRLFVCGIGKDTGTEEPGTLNLKSICQLHSCLRVCVWGGVQGGGILDDRHAISL